MFDPMYLVAGSMFVLVVTWSAYGVARSCYMCISIVTNLRRVAPTEAPTEASPVSTSGNAVVVSVYEGAVATDVVAVGV